MTARDHLNEYIMTSLRCVEGLDMTQIAERFGAEHRERILAASERWIASGDIVVGDSHLKIPAQRFLISDAIIESLFEL